MISRDYIGAHMENHIKWSVGLNIILLFGVMTMADISCHLNVSDQGKHDVSDVSDAIVCRI